MADIKPELLVVVSKIKQHMKKQGFKVSQQALERLSSHLEEVLTEGAKEAQTHKRKVIKGRDLFKSPKK